MAGVADAMPELSRGLISPLARAQYGALAAMRWSIFRNSIRSTRGAMELGARTVTAAVFAILGIGIAFALGMGAFEIASRGRWGFMPVLFWVVFVLWQVVPITLASFQQQFDMAGLLRFPVAFSAFFSLHLLFGLFDVSTIVGVLCCFGIWIGLSVARPELIAWSAIALMVFAAFNILLVRTVFSWIERWLAQRRTREIAMAVFFLAMLSLQVLNPAMGVVKFQSPNSPEAQALRERRQVKLQPWIGAADAVQGWLPPGAAALMVEEGQARRPLAAVGALGILGFFTLATGATLAVRLRAEFRGENLGDAPSRVKAERPRLEWGIGGSGPIAAVFERELRVLMRAIPLLYQLIAPVFIVFVLAGVNRNHNSGSFHLPMGLLLCLAYAFVGFTQLIYNNLGWEGPGIQLLFLSPTPIRTVLLGKNLFHAVLFTIDAVLVSIVACWRFGTPAADAMAASAAWVLFALPVHLGAGNFFSLAMPYKINLGRIGRQKGSQANALLSMLVQVVALGIGAGVFALCSYFDRLWLATVVFLALAVASTLGWLTMLRTVDAMAHRRRDDLISTLVKAE